MVEQPYQGFGKYARKAGEVVKTTVLGNPLQRARRAEIRKIEREAEFEESKKVAVTRGRERARQGSGIQRFAKNFKDSEAGGFDLFAGSQGVAGYVSGTSGSSRSKKDSGYYNPGGGLNDIIGGRSRQSSGVRRVRISPKRKSVTKSRGKVRYRTVGARQPREPSINDFKFV